MLESYEVWSDALKLVRSEEDKLPSKLRLDNNLYEILRAGIGVLEIVVEPGTVQKMRDETNSRESGEMQVRGVLISERQS